MDFVDILQLGGIILSLVVFAVAMFSLGVIWQKSDVNKKTKKLNHDDRKIIVGLKEDFVAGSEKVSEPNGGSLSGIGISPFGSCCR